MSEQKIDHPSAFLTNENPARVGSFDVPTGESEEQQERTHTLANLLSELEADETREAEIFPHIEQFIDEYGWNVFCNEILTNPSIKTHLANPEMSVSLLVECLDMLATPNTFSTDNIRTLLEQAAHSIDWVKIQSYLEIREATERGEMTTRSSMIRLLANHNRAASTLHRKSSVEEIQMAFRDAIREYPPDAYFSEFHRVKDARREQHFLDQYLNSYNFLPLLEEYCPPDWSVTSFARACYGVPLTHNLLALYSPGGRFLTSITIDRETVDNPPLHNVEAIYTLKDNQDFEEGESPADRAYRLLIRSFDILPQDWQTQLREHFLSRGLDIKAVSEKCRDYASADIIASAHPDVRLFTPVWFGEAIDEYIERRFSECSEQLTTAQKVDLESFATLFNQEFALPQRETRNILATLQSLNLDTMSYLEKTLGVDFASISLREIFGIVAYLKTTMGGRGLENLKKIVSSQSESARLSRIKSFLSLEQGGMEMGEKILTIAEHLDAETADAIFEQYAAVVELSREAVRYVAENVDIGKTGLDPEEFARRIQTDLLEEGKQLLDICAGKLIESKSNVAQKTVGRLILDYLATTRERVSLLKSTATALKAENPGIALSEVVNALRFETILPEDLAGISPENLAQMRRIYLENYAGESEDFQIGLLQGLDAKLRDPHMRLYTVMEDDKVRAFCTFQTKPDGSKYFGAFNVDPDLQSFRLGSGLLRESLDREAQDAVIHADCIPTDDISTYYISVKNFVGQRAHLWNGKLLLSIERDDALYPDLLTKKLPWEDIVAYANGTKTPPEDFSNAVFLAANLEQFDQLVKTAEAATDPTTLFPLLNEGYILTQFIRNKPSGRIFCAFEKDPKQESHHNAESFKN